MKSMTDPTPAQVLRQFRVVFNAVKAHFQQIEKKAGIGGAQIWALSVVSENPGIGMSALSRALDIHQSTTSNLVKALLQRGLLRAEKSEVDRRAVLLYIQPQGKQLLKRAPAPWEGVLPAALNQMSETDLRRMQKDLGKLIALLGEENNDKAAHIPLAGL